MAKTKKKKTARKSSGIGIRTKLFLWLLLIAIVPMFIIGATGYTISSRSLEQQSLDNLETSLGIQKKALEDYFDERLKNLESLSDDVQILQQKVMSKLKAIKSLKKQQVENFFKTRIQDTRIFAESLQEQQAFSRLSSSATAAASGGKYGPVFATWLEERNLGSIMLVDLIGRVIYSNDLTIKTGTSLLDSAGTPELKAFNNGIDKVSFTDFGQSELRDEEAVAYFSAPVKNGNDTIGVVLILMKNDGLDHIMRDQIGLGKHGENYLIGQDMLFRSNSPYFDDSILANPAFQVDTESVASAMQSKTGEHVIVNYRGAYVLSSYIPVDAAGITWALVVEAEQAEVMAPVRKGMDVDYLAAYAETYGYPDLYLFDPDGYAFYSAKRQADYKTNILTGLYSGSILADTVSRVLQTKDLVVSDYQHYEPANNKPSAFLAKPLLQDDKVWMIVVLRIPIDQIGAIMDIHGLGDREEMLHEHGSADTYLVGKDKLWRSESFQKKLYHVKSTILNAKIVADTVPVNAALEGKTGTELTLNPAGLTVLSSWMPFTFQGLQWALVSEISQDEVAKPVTRLFNISALIALAAVAAVFVISYLVSGGIMRQVGTIMHAMSRVEVGDFDAQAQVISKDELGAMATSFNKMITTTRELVDSRQQENDQLQESIIGLLVEIADISDGDLTVRATVHEDATGTVADSLNLMLEELGQAISKIKTSSEQVGDTADQVSSSTKHLAERNDAQSELITTAVDEINRMTAAIEQAATQADESATTSEQSREAAIEGTKAVEDTSRSMETIRSNVQDTARAIKRLGESSQEISDFAKTINDISDRTSILALNASIQASAAGEEGRGFAVVAEEIQRLAERAAGSTRQIETLIKNILSEITEAGASMDASIHEVVEGTALSENALAKLQDINERSAQVAELIGAVSLTTGEQAKTSVNLAKTMSDVGVISANTAEETRATSSFMHDMAAVADEMLQSVSSFKLPVQEEMAELVEEFEEFEDVSLEAFIDYDEAA